MGLLDIFDDDQGRLALGLLAASGPRMEPTSLGQRFAQALGTAQQAKVASEERQMTQEYRRSQIEAAQAQAAERQRQMQAAEQLERQMMQLDPTGRAAIVARLNPAKAAEMFMPQQGPKVGTPNPSDFTPESLAQYVKTNDIGVLRRLEPAPKPPAPLELERLQALRDALPPGDPRRAEVEAAIRKSTQFAPPMNVQVGLQAPVPYQLPNGQVGYIQPPNRPGAGPQVLEFGGAPVVRPTDDGKPTEGNAKAATYLGQMRSATEVLGPSGSSSISPILVAATNNPVTNVAAPAEAQKVAQAQRMWAEAKLRSDTGAAATEQEVKRNVITYFPQPGDTPEVIAQKAQMRLQAERNLMPQLGPLRKQFDQTNQPPAAAPSRNIPPAAINELRLRRGDPMARQQFDAAFGPGAADSVLGGR